MADFLKEAKKRVTEIVEVAGFKIEVRGLTIGELRAVSRDKGKLKDDAAFTSDLIVASCFGQDGKPLIPEDRKAELDDINPEAFKALNAAAQRVNGLNTSGNSNATDSGASSSD